MNYNKISNISYKIQRITDLIEKIIEYKENPNYIYPTIFDRTISFSYIEGFENDIIEILKKKNIILKKELDKEFES